MVILPVNLRFRLQRSPSIPGSNLHRDKWREKNMKRKIKIRKGDMIHRHFLQKVKSKFKLKDCPWKLFRKKKKKKREQDLQVRYHAQRECRRLPEYASQCCESTWSYLSHADDNDVRVNNSLPIPTWYRLVSRNVFQTINLCLAHPPIKMNIKER